MGNIPACASCNHKELTNFAKKYLAKMDAESIYIKALDHQALTVDEGLYLYLHAPTHDLIYIGGELRQRAIPGNVVTWQIDRNVNITNVCTSGCKFCNFHCKPGSPRAFTTTTEEYQHKIDELRQLGGNQLLLQGGLHPKLGLQFYCSLFRSLKNYYPDLVLHALGPPEIAHIARLEKMNYHDVLVALMDAGLDSLPGAGAEILTDRVRGQISPGKPNAQAWLDVMHEAHKLGLVTSATMMIGHIETPRERMEHLALLRELQNKKPAGVPGFLNFIVWTFQGKGTQLEAEGVECKLSSEEYIRTIALCRIMLNNIRNIQASWLTVGIEVAQVCLHAGANDMGSIMIEENVVSAAGAHHRMDAMAMQKAIIGAGFQPQLRNQRYEPIGT